MNRESTRGGDVYLVLSTFATEEDASRIGRELIERRLVACVSLLAGVRSIYRWEGRLADESEVLALMKTSGDRVPELLTVLPALHPYQVPEILAWPTAAAGAGYLAWLRGETG